MTKAVTYRVLGVMSGTSLDGIDLAVVKFFKKNHWTFKIEAAQTLTYPEHWVCSLKNAHRLAKEELQVFNKSYTHFLAQQIDEFLLNNNSTKIDFIASHGHTVLHQPQAGISLQIGNLPELSRLTKHKLVCDFRTQDVALGGQGAPLVPIGDRLLFGNYDYCLNLGGFSNLSFEHKQQRIAYDVCPFNTVLNRYAEKLGYPYDYGGVLASCGHVHKGLLEALNALAYYDQKPPKSLGIEWVQQEIFPLIDSYSINTLSKIATFTEHAAQQIASAFTENKTKTLCTGGGVYNEFFIERLKVHSKTSIEIPDKLLIDFKEAVVFAFLGVLKIRNEINCLASVTGAQKDHVSGVVFCP
ncbi:MAG: anhydro-N-acetylmuramic acid kinase [Flavobacteriaceae bacterium]|nr:anhydro-N-acetylmuramic acid kinase [Flavobacteriaceae bacterium]